MTNSKHLLLVADQNSYRIAPYLAAAKKLGLEVTIASQGKHSLITEIANGIHIDFEQPAAAVQQILQASQTTPFAGVLGSDDQTVELAALVAQALGLPHNAPAAARLSHRKDMGRAQLGLEGCPVPLNCLLDLTRPIHPQMAGLPWPCVLKPLNMSASRGVIRVDNETQFLAACEQLRPILATAQDEFEQTHALIEAYIDGIEIAYEGYLLNGQLNTITIFDKPDPLVGPYFEETIYVTPSRLSDALQQQIKTVLQQACKAYGLVTGAVHGECRIDPQEKVWILEVASRTIGGDCGRMLDHEGFSLEELAISLAINQPLAVTMPKQARGVMMIPIRQSGLLKSVEGLEAARNVPLIDKVQIIIGEGHKLTPLPDGNQYSGYIFASGDTPEQVTAAIREAHAKLEFKTAPIFPLMQSSA